jgi:protein SCO1
MSSPCSRRRALSIIAAGLGFAALPAAAQTTAGLPSEIHGRFRLEAPDGRIVALDDFAGRPCLVVFGFMSCPDICPTTLGELAQFLKEAGAKADTFDTVFISVDPEKDRPKALGEFVTSFDPRILGLTGSEAAVREAVVSFHALAEKIPQGDGYTMMHSVGIFLVDGKGIVVGFLDLDKGAAVALAQIEALG